jgi:phage baseplate assembly protein W
MAGDVTDELNFMLDKISNHALAHEIVFGDRPSPDKDGQLTPEDIHALVLTDGTGKGTNYVTFRAERGTPLDFEWPLVFRNEGFDVARRQYESAKKQLLDDSRDGNIDPASWTAIQAAVDSLVSELQRQYPRTRFQNDPQEFLVFNTAMRFLKSKASMVFQARIAADTAYLTDRYIFDGQTVLDLVRHMAQNGLRFAPPEEGGDGAYPRLFMVMRQLYLRYYGSET